jgi:hypothetical protein
MKPSLQNCIMQILETDNPLFELSNSPNHYWRTEPAPHVDPSLVKRSIWYAVQHVFCRRDTGELVGIIRRFPSQFKTAWFSGNSVTVKRHFSLQAAKKFLERQFTRTVPSGSVWKTEHAHVAPQHPPCSIPTFHRFNVSTHPSARRLCAGAQVINVNFCRSRKSKIEIRSTSRITNH